MASPDSSPLQTDAHELLLGSDARYVCETYIFDPVAGEESLGRLFAVAETEERGGVGTELVDLVVQSLQREYYRDPARGVLVSFESALHQANLVLHDTAEHGVRDWMGYFHVAIGVLAGHDLHVSAAGEAAVFLVRKSMATNVASDLAHSPVTNPLRTFAQVASGTVQTRDVLFLGTSHFMDVFQPEDLQRFSIDHSASTIGTRLQQLYTDRAGGVPLAMLTLSLLPRNIVQPRQEAATWQPLRRQPREVRATLAPRKPLVINRSYFGTLLLLGGKIIMAGGMWLKTWVWPWLVRGSVWGGRTVLRGAQTSGQKVRGLAQQRLQQWQQRSPASHATDSLSPASHPAPSLLTPKKLRLPPLSTVATLPRRAARAARRRFSQLPKSSKVFAGLTVLLIVALAVSLVLLRQKRIEDAAIQHASELLNDARAQLQTAETALIYDNRDEAVSLLATVQEKTNQVKDSGAYAQEALELERQLNEVRDRVQRIVRTSTETTRVVGDFGDTLQGKPPTLLAFVNDTLFTANPETNQILALAQDGAVTVASDTSEGVGFFTAASIHAADKTVTLATSAPGIALFDAKNNSLQSMEVLPNFSPSAAVSSLAVYGARLYLYDTALHNIMSYSKTLRGFSGGSPWITAADFPKDTITSIAVDGDIYTLHTDGTIRKLLKGEPQEFSLDSIEPPLTSAKKIIKTEEMTNLYVLDATQKRVVVFSTEGQLLQQLYLDVAHQLTDIAIAADESTLYALDGTRVLAVTLKE